MLSSTVLEAEVLQLNTQIAQLSSQLDAKMGAFAASLPAVAATWMTKETKDRIECNAAKVNAAGLDKVREIKSDLGALIATLPEKCENAIAHESDWPHRRVAATAQSTERQSDREYYFISVFRDVISHLGGILDRHGLLVEPFGRHPSWTRSVDGNFRYGINPGFEPHTLQSVAEYNVLLIHLRSIVGELERKQDELARAKATELWDSV